MPNFLTSSVKSVKKSVAELPSLLRSHIINIPRIHVKKQRPPGLIPHSADVGRIFLSVVKTWKPNAFGLKLCSVSLT
ncbi:hypothetical protein, partial [Microcoleus sp. PH2017_22_RUC_O_B]|uniref:hypothetical protein n=1 Tax=Microcoleus sp. PH2017_22_RUC_O_B TaxID=2798833 RepID=UPI0025EB0D1C